MTDIQKLIKVAAIALAIILIVSIVGGVVKLVAGLSWLIGLDDGQLAGESKSYALSQYFDRLVIDIGAARLRIQCGAEFKLESNHSKLRLDQSDGSLRIYEDRSFGGNYNGVFLTLTVPSETVFRFADIRAGAGKVYIQALSAYQLQLEFGAGEVQIDHLQGLETAQIRTGAGKVSIHDALLQDLDLDMGVGELKLTAALLGENSIEQGIGAADLCLLGEISDYTISVEKGIGDIHFDGQRLEDDHIFGSGDVRLDIEGGIGEISITTAA